MYSVRVMLVLLVLGDLIGEEGVHASVLHALNTNCMLFILMERGKDMVSGEFEDGVTWSASECCDFAVLRISFVECLIGFEGR